MEIVYTGICAEQLSMEDGGCPKWRRSAPKCVDPHKFQPAIFSKLAETSGFYSTHIINMPDLHLKR